MAMWQTPEIPRATGLATPSPLTLGTSSIDDFPPWSLRQRECGTTTRVSGDRTQPPRARRSPYPWLIAFALLLVPFSSWTLQISNDNGAVMRVPLDRVPEEKVVSFGHADHGFEPSWQVENEAGAELEGPSEAIFAESSAPLHATSRVAKTTLPGRAVGPDRNGVLPIGYSLPQGVSSQEGGVGVSKTLAVEEGTATGLRIFLIGGSLIEIDRGELVAALGQLGAPEKAQRLPAANEAGRLSLESVRMAGLDVRYDAIRDRLVLRP